MNQKWSTYLFEYDHHGQKLSFEILAESEQDAKQRIERISVANYVGVLQMKIPVELGVFARFICWWQNRQPLKFFLDT